MADLAFYNGTRDGRVHVHKKGCADTNRGEYRHIDRPWLNNCSSVEEIVKDVYPVNEFNYEEGEWEDYLSEIRIFPCCLPMPYQEGGSE